MGNQHSSYRCFICFDRGTYTGCPACGLYSTENPMSRMVINTELKPKAPTSTADPVNQPQDGVKYLREIKPGVFVDVYDVLRAFAVVNPALQHLIKKALAVGQRGHKDAAEDLRNIYESAKRAIELEQDNA